MNTRRHQYPTEMSERDRKVLSDLEEIRDRFARTNERPDFATIREHYPDAAKVFFRGQSLRFANLNNADLRYIDFRGTDLTGSTFDGARILGARFEMAKVSRDALRAARDWYDYKENWEPTDPKDQVQFRRRPWERFSLSPHLPELVMLPNDLVFPGEDAGLSKEEAEYLAEGCLSIAIRCLDLEDWTRVVLGGRSQPKSSGAVAFPSYKATSFCARLNARADEFGLPLGTRVTVPGYGLMRRLALAPGRVSAERPRHGDTDLFAKDLAVGTDARELVENCKDGVTLIAAAHIRLPQDLHVGRFELLDGAQAYFRPLFLLGSVAP